eukprot:1123683-Prymnesium_polylepis.5
MVARTPGLKVDGEHGVRNPVRDSHPDEEATAARIVAVAAGVDALDDATGSAHRWTARAAVLFRA